jgi:[ribosomal protein S18]-alanine N-acetyltransferase
MLHISKATTDDLDRMVEIEKQYQWCPGWGKKTFLEEIDLPNSCVLVCKIENKTVGYVCCKVRFSDIEILNLGVDREYVRNGIAKKLFEELFFIHNDCKLAMLEVNERNAIALDFYKKMGFVIVGRRTKFYNNLDDALLLNKDLTLK